jgi:hypothetical protein
MITYDSEFNLTTPLMVGTPKYTYPIPDNYNVYLVHQDFVIRSTSFTDPVLGSGMPNGGGHLAQQTNVRTLKGGLLRYTNIYAFNFRGYKRVTEQNESVSFPAFKADHFTYKEHYRIDWKPAREVTDEGFGEYKNRPPRTVSEYRGGKEMIFRDAFNMLVPVEVTETIETESTSKSATGGQIGDLPDNEVPKDVINMLVDPALAERLKKKALTANDKYDRVNTVAPYSGYNPFAGKFQIFIDLEKQLSVKLEQFSEANKVTAETWKNEKGIQLKTDLSPDIKKEALSSYGSGGKLTPANFSAYAFYYNTPDFVRYIGTDMQEMIDKYGIGSVKVNYVSHLTTPTFDQYKGKIGRKEMIPFPVERTQLFGDLYLVKRFRCNFL